MGELFFLQLIAMTLRYVAFDVVPDLLVRPQPEVLSRNRIRKCS